MAFKKFNPREHIRGLAQAARQIQREEQHEKTVREVKEMVRAEARQLELPNIVSGSRLLQ